VFNNPPLNVHPYSLARGVAIGLLPVATYVPVVQKMCDRILELTSGHSAKMLDTGDWQMKHSPQEMTSETQFFVDEIYGLNTAKRDFLYKHIGKLEFGHTIDSPVMNMLFDRDTSGHQHIFAA